MSKSKTSKASKAVKRKHVMREILEDDYRPPQPHQKIVKVLRCDANNLHKVRTVEGDEFLVSMPNKFRKFMWLRRNGYVVIEPIEEGDKVKGEIVKVITREHIKYYKMENAWPSEFEDPYERQSGRDYNEDFLFENPNQRRYPGRCEESDDDEDSDDDDESRCSDDDDSAEENVEEEEDVENEEEEEEDSSNSRECPRNESDIEKCVVGVMTLGAGAGDNEAINEPAIENEQIKSIK